MSELESDLAQSFVEVAQLALPHVRIFRRNIVNVETRDGWRARAGIKGQADYYAIVQGGRHVEIETKAAKPKWYAQQKAWRDFCGRFSIPYLILRALPRESNETTVARWVEELTVLVGPMP